MDVYDALARARAAGRRAALVTVLAVEGDAPSHPGAKVVVEGPSADAAPAIVAGTLGCSEFDTAGLELAAEALEAGGTLRRRLTFPGHGRERAVELFAEVHDPGPAVIVIGANPVGRAVAGLAHWLGRRGVLVAPGGDTGASPGTQVRADDPARFLLAAPPGPGDAVVVCDHDASWVDEVLRVALASDAGYVGMLGSRRHAPAAVRRLRDAGTPPAHLARLRSPMGLDIGSRTPEEIALAVAAEILAHQRGRRGSPLGGDWGGSA